MSSALRKFAIPSLVAFVVALTAIEFSSDGGLVGAMGLREGRQKTIELLFAGTSAEPAVHDGVVSEAELKSALDAAADCIEAEGIPVIRYGDPRMQGRIGFAANYEGTIEVTKVQPVVERCENQYARDAQMAYAMQSQPEAAPQGNERKMLACLQAKGVSIDHAPQGKELGHLFNSPQTHDAFVACAEHPVQR
jgi:hypothetical protein